MTEFISRNCGKEGYEIIIKTDSYEHYRAAVDFARRLIDHSKPKTNADRIRAMSDERMAVFLDGFSSRCLDCAEDAKNQSCPIYKEGHYCRPQDIMEWLQQPAEEADNEAN